MNVREIFLWPGEVILRFAQDIIGIHIETSEPVAFLWASAFVAFLVWRAMWRVVWGILRRKIGYFPAPSRQ